jgi:hypothetical protein
MLRKRSYTRRNSELPQKLLFILEAQPLYLRTQGVRTDIVRTKW